MTEIRTGIAKGEGDESLGRGMRELSKVKETFHLNKGVGLCSYMYVKTLLTETLRSNHFTVSRL